MQTSSCHQCSFQTLVLSSRRLEVDKEGSDLDGQVNERKAAVGPSERHEGESIFQIFSRRAKSSKNCHC